MFALLDDALDHAPRKVVPVDHTLCDGRQVNARLSQRMNPVARFDRIKPSEPVLIPGENRLEILAVLSVSDHASEIDSFLGSITADGIISVPTGDFVTVLSRISHDSVALEGWLLVCRSTVGDSRLPESACRL